MRSCSMVMAVLVPVFGRPIVDGRYTWGLLDIDKQIDESTIRNRSSAFMTGVRF